MQRKCKEGWLQRYIQRAKVSEAPSYLHFWAGVSTIASITQRRTYLDMETFTLIPNFYIIFVAPPGVATKSSTIEPVKTLLNPFEVHGVVKAKATTTREEFIKSFAANSVRVQYPGKDLGEYYNAISIVASELGTFLDLTNHQLVNNLTDLWDGISGKWDKGTKTQGTDVLYSPVLNMLGGTTPSWVETNMAEFMIGGGFTSRTIFIHAEKKSQFIPYPKKLAREIGFDIEAWEEDLAHDLEIIRQKCGCFTLTENAEEYGEWYYIEQIQKPLSTGDLPDDLRWFYSRKQGHAHKLAMIISLSERDDLLITKNILQRAVALMDVAEGSRTKVLASVGETKESKIVADIRRLLQNHKRISMTALYKRYQGRADIRTIENAINLGHRSGYWQNRDNFVLAVD